MTTGRVVAVAKDSEHRFSKETCSELTLVAGLGVMGDAHFGAAVQHRSRVAADPSQPNLRQVHLIHVELQDELLAQGFRVAPGVMGENITTQGVDLLGLPTGSLLKIGDDALICITGLRNPCKQIDDYQSGMLKAVLDRDINGHPVRKAGIMGVIIASGTVKPGDNIMVALPPKPHKMLDRV